MNKKMYTFRALLIVTLSCFFACMLNAQAPNTLSYQSVIRDSGNDLVKNQRVGIRISILQGESSGIAVYSEIQTPSTNDNGLVSIQIGSQPGFDTINWSNGPYYIKTETDPAGGSNYGITNTSQMLSVPFALYANTAERSNDYNELENRVFELEFNSGKDSVADFEGNYYKVIKIGKQYWMAENLRSTRLYDGSDLTLVTNDTTWINTETPSYCWYDNDSASYARTYGALYKWYTISTGKLCPSGWHVPTDSDWKELEMSLGMSQADADNTGSRGTTQGSQLAGNDHLWTDGTLDSSPVFGSSGFNALPSGFRSINGTFMSLGNETSWWCTTKLQTDKSWRRTIDYTRTTIERAYGGIDRVGFPVRCVKY